MDKLLVGFILFDVIALYYIYRFMINKLNSKLAIVEERQRARWARDEGKLKTAFATEEE
ncbi:MAG: hypothetical protein HOE69_00365 [Euryarchaeota archaeon]|jgi:hypothetical protein|nr:hypothetical protein [Euryarchaeota archaeon]